MDVRRLLRPTAFGWGLIAGLASFALIWFGAYLVLRTGPAPAINVDVTSVGADVTRHGGAKLIVANETGAKFTVTCRDACDDLRFRTLSGENRYGVRVLDAKGDCVACGPAVYTDAGYGAPVWVWRIAGQDRLNVEPTLMTLEANGELTPAPAPAPDAARGSPP